ncbi:unnamed protein product [Protopolystoma xenopodis]|uniref:Uncharacterized protein n=1 Tax=Protopolystoma xenopodis TaxID=117903 RepID=A0A3S5ACI0_9PLAT|nr:unnamed protein product [Protopolystoma xenopodis]
MDKSTWCRIQDTGSIDYKEQGELRRYKQGPIDQGSTFPRFKPVSAHRHRGRPVGWLAGRLARLHQIAGLVVFFFVPIDTAQDCLPSFTGHRRPGGVSVPVLRLRQARNADRADFGALRMRRRPFTRSVHVAGAPI